MKISCSCPRKNHVHIQVPLKHPSQTCMRRSSDCQSSGLIHTDWWFPVITDHHLDPSFHTLWLPRLCFAHTVYMCARISVYAACDNNPFSSRMADTCRKPRLCRVKSSPFLHEIRPCRCMDCVRHEACHMRFSAWMWSSVRVTASVRFSPKVSRPAQRCVWAREVTHGVLINQLCGHVSLLGEESKTKHVKGTERVCVCVCVCVCLLPSHPDVSHI